jgi:hypothetical protein
MGDLIDTIEAINARLTGVSVAFGREKLKEHASPPRVVWWLIGFSAFPPARHGGGFTANAPRAVNTIGLRVGCQVWAAADSGDVRTNKNTRELLTLLNRVLYAIHRETYGAYTLAPGEQIEEGQAHLGRAVTFEVVFMVPVTEVDSTVTTQTITSVPIEGVAVFPSGDVTGIPAP